MKNSEQQRLFEHYNPLEDRLGIDFFENLPHDPGVYKMYGRNGSLLYVGKAKNLRTRLFTYRRAKVGKASRKTVRLIRMVHDIEYELCKTEKEALLLENDLIRKKRPEFNHAKKSPETYYFVHLKPVEDGLLFKLNMRPQQDKSWKTFGAFKGHLMVRKALGALFRLLYICQHQIDTTHHLPSVLLKKLTPLDYRFETDGSPIIQPSVLEDLFSGSSEDFFTQVSTEFKSNGLLDCYIGKLILEDLEAVKRFYEKCCRRNYEIVEHFELPGSIVPQKKLDDYLIELAFEKSGDSGTDDDTAEEASK